MSIVSLGDTVLLADAGGDRPALIVRVLTAKCADVTGFVPLPEFIPAVTIHADRAAALNAALTDGKAHAYWPAKV